MNLQTAFLSPPVAMSAFYLKGVAPPHVTLNQIFLGMLPFMGIQVLGIILLYAFPAIGLWLPELLYKSSCARPGARSDPRPGVFTASASASCATDGRSPTCWRHIA